MKKTINTSFQPVSLYRVSAKLVTCFLSFNVGREEIPHTALTRMQGHL